MYISVHYGTGRIVVVIVVVVVLSLLPFSVLCDAQHERKGTEICGIIRADKRMKKEKEEEEEKGSARGLAIKK